MKKQIRAFFEKFGLEIHRPVRTPYQELLDLPRYQDTQVTLLDQPFWVADPASFYWSYREIFCNEIYRFRAESGNAPSIVDCGANYGTSVLYFKTLYPACNIVAVEPDPHVFGLLERNIRQRGFGDEVRLIQKAVSNTAGPVTFFREGADGGRIHGNTESKERIEIETVRLDELLAEPKDFLKMDIEGAEVDVLCGARNLGNVSQLFIEYHSFADAAQELGALLSKLTAEGFRYYIHTQFCSSRPLTQEQLQLGMDLQLNLFAKRTIKPDETPHPL